MARYPETRALLEQALRHLLAEQEQLLKREDANEVANVFLPLCQLAIATSNTLAEGIHRVLSTSHLTKTAREIERTVDALSESLWRPIPISISAIFERIEQSRRKPSGRRGIAADTRANYHNLRIRLLEQLLGARMLALNSDLGDENERIWQHFLERHLGPMFRVLRGGHIVDHDGSTSNQIDLIVVPADAHIFFPGGLDDGKALVLVDQVISAILITSNLTAAKLKVDWAKLQSIPVFPDTDSDHPQLKGHSWPLCYMLAAQSDAAEDLEVAWKQSCVPEQLRLVPELVITLDTGFLYCGLPRWPCPRYPGNYTDADHVNVELGIYGGLGLAWLITQHQWRLAVTQRQNLNKISRFARLLDEATLKEAVPATYSHRFDTMFQMGTIAGVIEWGHYACWAHNRLQLRSLRIRRGQQNDERLLQTELHAPGTDSDAVDWRSATNRLRWFGYGVFFTVDNLLAVEEWRDHKSPTNHKRRVAVFNSATGEEVTGPLVDTLTRVSDIEANATRLLSLASKPEGVQDAGANSEKPLD